MYMCNRYYSVKISRSVLVSVDIVMRRLFTCNILLPKEQMNCLR